MEYELIGKNLVIHLPEELDHHSCRDLRQDSESLLMRNEIKRIVLDFSSTSFMDSSGIGVILGRYKRMQESGGDVAIYGARRRAERLIKMSGIEKLVKKYDDIEGALLK